MGGVNLNARVFLENLHKIEVVLTPCCSYAYIICTCVDPLLFSRTHHVCLFVCFVGQSLIFWFEFKQYYTHDNRLKLTLYKSCIIKLGICSSAMIIFIYSFLGSSFLSISDGGGVNIARLPSTLAKSVPTTDGICSLQFGHTSILLLRDKTTMQSKAKDY